MATKILMPKTGFIATQGTIVEWLKKPGDHVKKGEPLVLIESEKATIEVESPETGILGPDLAPPGTVVPIAAVIGYILEPGEEPPEPEFDFGQISPESVSGGGESPQKTEGSVTEKRDTTPAQQRAAASPSARRLAKEYGVSLSEIKGSGPGGRIVERDVLAYVSAASASEGPEVRHTEKSGRRVTPAASRLASELGVDLGEVEGTGFSGRVTVEDVRRVHKSSTPSGPVSELVELTTVQQVAAERMSSSFSTAPHFYLSIQVNMDKTVVMKERLTAEVEQKTGIKLSYSDILLYVVSRVLRNHLFLNASYEKGRIRKYREINIALAVDTPRGLITPVFHKADQLSLANITSRRAELVKKARDNRLSPKELSNSTFTISNLGMFGIDLFSAIINPPQAAILAIGKIAERPTVVNGVVQMYKSMWMTLSVDHRVADGATAARFLQDVVHALEEPALLFV